MTQTDKEPITAEANLLYLICGLEEMIARTVPDRNQEQLFNRTHRCKKLAATLQAQLEQSEARLALVVDALKDLLNSPRFESESCGETIVNLSVSQTRYERHFQALTATTEQVSSYRASLIQQGREQGVRESIEAINSHPYGYLMDSEIFKALQSLQNQGGV